jgi:hypothetical protein
VRWFVAFLLLAACSKEEEPCVALACTSGFDIVITPDGAEPSFARGDYVLELNVAGSARTIRCDLRDTPRCDSSDVVVGLSPAGVFQLAVHLPVVATVSIAVRAACSPAVLGEQTFTPQYQTADNGCGGQCTQASGAMVVRSGPALPICTDGGVMDATNDAIADASFETATDSASDATTFDATDSSPD